MASWMLSECFVVMVMVVVVDGPVMVVLVLFSLLL